MGFKAPPATNVIVAPGSAMAKLDIAQIQKSNFCLHCTWFVRSIATFARESGKRNADFSTSHAR